MKLTIESGRCARENNAKAIGPARRAELGSAVLIILVLLGVMSVLAVSNGIALRRLRTELQMLEKRQQRALTIQEQFIRENRPPSEPALSDPKQ